MLKKQNSYAGSTVKQKVGAFVKKRSASQNPSQEPKRMKAFSITYENGEVEELQSDDILNGFSLF